MKKKILGLAAGLLGALVALAAVMPAHAQSAFDSNFNLNYPGVGLNLGQLFALDALFGTGTGLFGTGGTTYVVQSGDTLRAIANRFYGNSNLYTVIANANNIANPNVIYRGQQLVIPSVNGSGLGTYNNGLGVNNNNLSNLFVYSRLFNGNKPVSLGDLFIMNRLFNNSNILGTGVNSNVVGTSGYGTGSGLGTLFIYDQLFGGGYNNSGYYPNPNPNTYNPNPNNNYNTSTSPSGY
jgi:LysM repeat protein